MSELSSELQGIYAKIMSRIGKSKPKFKYPDGSVLRGHLVDRVAMYQRSLTDTKDTFRVIDLIEFEEKQVIRFGYYIYENNNLRWGSQTTFTEFPDRLVDLFKKASQKDWFKDVIEKVETDQVS